MNNNDQTFDSEEAIIILTKKKQKKRTKLAKREECGGEREWERNPKWTKQKKVTVKTRFQFFFLNRLD